MNTVAPTTSKKDGTAHFSVLLSRFAGLASVFVGLLALLGWKFDRLLLTQVRPGLASMKTVTAMAILLLGFSLWLLADETKARSQNWAGLACATAAFLIGALTFLESAFHADFRVDDLLARAIASAAATGSSQRPSSITALCITLLGAALLVLGRRIVSLYPSQVLGLCSAVIGTAALIGYALSVDAFYRIPGYSSMALPTAATITAISIGIVFARPRDGLVAALNRDTADGRLARLLLPCAVLIPILFAWLRLRGQQRGLYGTEVGIIIHTLIDIVCFVIFLYVGVNQLGRALSKATHAQEQFKRLVESAPDAMIIADERGRITLVNAQTQTLFGYPGRELVGQSVEILVPQRSRDKHPAHRASFFAEPKIRPMGAGLELYALRKDGSEFPVEISLSPLQTDEGSLVSSTIRDITERKKFQRTLEEKNVELENANRAKDRFLATMSHELRTPLNAIIGFTGTLLMKLPGPLSTGQEKQLRTIQASGRHLLSLINDLLDLAKIEAGKVQLKVEPVPCQTLLEEVVAALRPQAEGKGLQFDLAMPDEGVVVLADRRALKQILINLTSNAIKFTEQGFVRLQLAEHHGNGACAEISVTDSGIGIRREDQDKLFHAFARVETDQTRHLEGTGLGLHLSQRLAGLLDAKLTLASEPGKGSRFAVLLPRK